MNSPASFRGNGFIREILFQLISIFCLHSSVVVLVAIEIIFVDMKRSRKEKSRWVKTKVKTGPKKKKSGEFGDEKKKILADSDKGWIYLVRRGPLPRLVLRSILCSRFRAKNSPSNLIKSCKLRFHVRILV